MVDEVFQDRKDKHRFPQHVQVCISKQILIGKGRLIPGFSFVVLTPNPGNTAIDYYTPISWLIK